MSFTGWAVTLNGVTVISSCDSGNVDHTCANADNLIIDGLDRPPEGLDLPALRTEDVTYAQRDGTRHFNDWYESRIITLQGTIGPEDGECEACTTVRRQRSELLKAWRRSCCDIELVVHTPCDGEYDEGDPVLGPQTIRRNLIWNPSFELSLDGWSVPADSFCRSYDRCYAMDSGTTWCYSNAIDGAFTTSRRVDGGWVGNSYMRIACDTVPTNPGIGFTYGLTSLVSPQVSTGGIYTASAYMRSSGVQSVVAEILWYDSIGTLLGVTPGDSVDLSTDWERVSVSAVAPQDAEYVHVQFVTTDVTGWIIGGTLDIDGALLETGDALLPYFDGDTPDENPTPAVGAEMIQNAWTAAHHNSISIQSSQTYEENLDRSLYGPFGIIGRPRVAQSPWLSRKEEIAEFTLRFDAIDQRMYVLDECGTPGYQTCNTLTPGLETQCRTYDLCYADGGRCYTNSDVGAVLPTIVTLGGTERVNPLIVLYPGLSYPTIENLDTGEYITFNGVVSSEPIQIDTENGIATGVDTGQSYTELLGGSIFLSIVPGQTTFRMFSRASDDPGSAAICYRDTVVMG